MAVHFQSITEKLSPHDIIYSFAAASELTDPRLASACSLHTASMKTSNDSLPSRSLAEIAEDEAEPQTEVANGYEEGQEVWKEPSLLPPPDDDKTRHEKVNEILNAVRANGTHPAHKRSSSTTTTNSLRPRTASDTNKALPLIPDDTPRESLKPRSIYDFDDSNSTNSFDARVSSDTTRPNTRDSGSVYEHKPKVKLGPRPSTESTSSMRDEFRPVASLPAGLRMSSRQVASARPTSRQSQRSFANIATSKDSLPVPLPASPTRLTEHTIPAPSPGRPISVKTQEPKTPKMTPEKRRLMKALQLRQKQLAAQSPPKVVGLDPESAESIHSPPAVDDVSPHSPANVPSINRDPNIIHGTDAHPTREAPPDVVESPTSAPEPSDGPSTQASSVSEEDEFALHKQSEIDEESILKDDEPSDVSTEKPEEESTTQRQTNKDRWTIPKIEEPSVPIDESRIGASEVLLMAEEPSLLKNDVPIIEDRELSKQEVLSSQTFETPIEDDPIHMPLVEDTEASQSVIHGKSRVESTTLNVEVEESASSTSIEQKLSEEHDKSDTMAGDRHIVEAAQSTFSEDSHSQKYASSTQGAFSSLPPQSPICQSTGDPVVALQAVAANDGSPRNESARTTLYAPTVERIEIENESVIPFSAPPDPLTMRSSLPSNKPHPHQIPLPSMSEEEVRDLRNFQSDLEKRPTPSEFRSKAKVEMASIFSTPNASSQRETVAEASRSEAAPRLLNSEGSSPPGMPVGVDMKPSLTTVESQGDFEVVPISLKTETVPLLLDLEASSSPAQQAETETTPTIDTVKPHGTHGKAPVSSKLETVPLILDPRDSSEAQTDRQVRRRGVVNPIPQLSTEERSDEQFLLDDSFMEELKTATLQEAKPISVSKSPAKPVMSRSSSEQKSGDASRGLRSSSSPLDLHISNERPFSPPRLPTPISVRSVSAKQYPVSNVQSTEVPSQKKVGVSSGISQRIKALEQLSSHPTSPTSPSPTQFAFAGLRQASSNRTPPGALDVESGNASRSRPNTGYPSPASSPEAVKYDPISRVSKPRPESVSVTATIIRDASNRLLEKPMNLSEPRNMNLHHSPLVVEHQTMEPKQQQPIELPLHSPLKPPRPRYGRQSTARSGSSSSTEQKNDYQPASRRSSVASKRSLSSRNGSDLDLPRSLSDGSINGEEKKDSKRNRLMKRMSSITSMSRRSFAQALNSSPKEASIMEQHEPVIETKAATNVDLGDVNIQFPDTLVRLFTTGGNFDTERNYSFGSVATCSLTVEVRWFCRHRSQTRSANAPGTASLWIELNHLSRTQKSSRRISPSPTSSLPIFQIKTDRSWQTVSLSTELNNSILDQY